jgi:flagellar FliL protein
MGVIGGGAAKVKEELGPKLVRKGEVDPYAPKAEGGKEGEGAAEVEGEGAAPTRPATTISARISPRTSKAPPR